MNSTCPCEAGATWVSTLLWGTYLGLKDAAEVIISEGPYPILPPWLCNLKTNPAADFEVEDEKEETELQALKQPDNSDQVEEENTLNEND